MTHLVLECYINTQRCSHIAVCLSGPVTGTRRYWHSVCGMVGDDNGFRLSDAPERPLCKRCQKLRELKDVQEAKRED